MIGFTYLFAVLFYGRDFIQSRDFTVANGPENGPFRNRSLRKDTADAKRVLFDNQIQKYKRTRQTAVPRFAGFHMRAKQPVWTNDDKPDRRPFGHEFPYLG